MIYYSNKLQKLEYVLRDVEEKLFLQPDSFQNLTKGQIDTALTNKKMEEFISYEIKKKFSGMNGGM